MTTVVLSKDDFVELAKKKQRLIYYYIGSYILKLYFYDGLVHKTTIDYSEEFKDKPNMAFKDYVEHWLEETFKGLELVRVQRVEE